MVGKNRAQVSSARTGKLSAGCRCFARERAGHLRDAGLFRAAAQAICGVQVLSAPPRKPPAGRGTAPHGRAGYLRGAGLLRDGAEGSGGVVFGVLQERMGGNGR